MSPMRVWTRNPAASSAAASPWNRTINRSEAAAEAALVPFWKRLSAFRPSVNARPRTCR